MQSALAEHEGLTTYMAGSVLDKRKLRNGDTARAEACVLLTNKNSKSANE